MKKISAILLIVLIISVFISGCMQQQLEEETAGDEVTGSITEVDTVDEELDSDELDSELDSLEEDLANW